MKRRIIFLVNWSWQIRDYRRFGIELLTKRGFQPEIWDIGIVYDSDFDGGAHPLVSLPHLNHRVFEDSATLVLAISNLSSRDCVISTFAENRSHHLVFDTIRKTSIPYGISFLSLEPSDVHTIVDRATYIFFHFVANPKLFLHRLLKKISQKNNSKHNNGPPPSFLIVPGKAWSKIPASQRFVRKAYHGKIIKTHNYDYDTTLMNLGEEQTTWPTDSDDRYALFIDQCLPAHFAFYIVAESNRPAASKRKNGQLRDSELEGLRYCSKNIYYHELNQFFSEYEDRTGLEIVIASHPKNTLAEVQELFLDRRVIFDKTINLVRDSTCVLTHFSTAISFSVIYKKPAILLDSRNYHVRCRQKIRRYAKHLGCSVINISSKNKNPFNAEVDHKKYDKYLTEFVKHPGSEDSFLWDTFSNFLDKTS